MKSIVNLPTASTGAGYVCDYMPDAVSDCAGPDQAGFTRDLFAKRQRPSLHLRNADLRTGDVGSRGDSTHYGSRALGDSRLLANFFRGPIRLCIALLAVLFCAGCVSVPVIAKTNTGEKFVGSATATLTSGTFELTSARGVRCWGTYNQWDPSANLVVNFRASTRQYGTALIARDAQRTSGIGTGVANDGTKFDFFMG
jgi:hypothetical protein